jgi:hypothetical protein
MTSASGTLSGCIVSVGSLAGGVAGAPLPANSLQAFGLLWSFYILNAGDTPALQSEAATGRIVVQASNLQLQASGLLSKGGDTLGSLVPESSAVFRKTGFSARTSSGIVWDRSPLPRPFHQYRRVVFKAKFIVSVVSDYIRFICQPDGV